MRIPLIVISSLVGIFMTASVWGQDSQSRFPLGRDLAGDRELPLPYGIGLNGHYQKQDYDLEKLRVNLPMFDPAQAAGVAVTNRTTEGNLKLDLWFLPFLNVFAIVGYVDGETEVALGPPFGDLDIDYDGIVYGGGITLAAGTEQFFGSLTAVYTESDLDVSTSSVKTWVLTPKAGIRTGFGEVWIGAMYQQTEEKHEGSISIPTLGTVAYEVELEEENPWNYLAGVHVDLGDRWDLELEGGIGDRKHVTASLVYRF